MAQWNPPPPDSPPHEKDHPQSGTADYNDTIGNTVFSKAWVLSLLVKAVAAVGEEGGKSEGDSLDREGGMSEGDSLDREGGKSEGDSLGGRFEAGGQDGLDPPGKKQRDDVNGGLGEVKSGPCSPREHEIEGDEEREGESVQELSDSLENDLCRLWDASMNTDVTAFLLEQCAVDLLLGVASRSTFPRLTEICIGILGNMACLEDVCLRGFSSKEQVCRVLCFLESSDSRTLFETTRLIYTCLSHEKLAPLWMSEIEESPHVFQAILFVLQSSTNDDLLRSVAVLLDRLLDTSEHLLKQWASRELVEAICEGAEQSRLSSFDATSTFVLTLQLLSTVETGVPFLIECETSVCPLLCNFLLGLEQEEGYYGDHSGPITAALSLLVTLSEASSSDYVKESLSAPNIQQCLSCLLHKLPSSNSQPASSVTMTTGDDTGSDQEHSSIDRYSPHNTTSTVLGSNLLQKLLHWHTPVPKDPE